MTRATIRAKTSKEKPLPFREIYEEARRQWFDGEYQATLDLLSTVEPSTAADKADAALLQSRALFRAGRYEEALAAAKFTLSSLDSDRVATAYLLQASALIRLERYKEGAALLDQVDKVKSAHKTIEAEILVQRAFVAYIARDFVSARAYAVKAVGRAHDIVLARAQELVGYINSGEEKFGEALRSFQQAMGTLRSSEHRDVKLEANLFSASAALAAERLETTTIADFDESFARLRWTGDIANIRFQAYQNAGALHFVAGDFAVSWRLFSDALRYTRDGNLAYRVMGLTNLAMLHRYTKDSFAAKQSIGYAAELIDMVDWPNADADERAALVEYAIEAVRLGVPVTASAVERYEALPEGKGAWAFDKRERRMQAMVLTARGLVAGQSNPVRAVKILERALKAWTDFGYRMRAAMTAMDIYRLTEDVAFLDEAKRLTRGVRRTFLTDALLDATKKEKRGLVDLTPAERTLLDDILLGKSNVTIARETGKALQTIKNQMRAIFIRMKVSSRSELLLLCAELGLVPGAR